MNKPPQENQTEIRTIQHSISTGPDHDFTIFGKSIDDSIAQKFTGLKRSLKSG